MSTLFKSQELISQDVKLMSEASTQTREDMNLLLLNQQQIMTALKLQNSMIRTPTTSVVAVPAPSNIPSFFAKLDNNPKGEKMVGPSEHWNQQVAGHQSSKDHKERLELKLLR